jgi:hypothetical protein
MSCADAAAHMGISAASMAAARIATRFLGIAFIRRPPGASIY